MKSKHNKSNSLKTILIVIIILLFFSCDDFSFYSLGDNDELGISPEFITLYADDECIFTGLDGSPPYSFSILSGDGSVDSESGLYTAPGTETNDIILITDSEGDTDTATVMVIEPLTISPSSITLVIGATQPFAVTGGVEPYTFSVFSGIGTIDSSTGLYTAPGITGTAIVRVTDSTDNFKDADVTIAAAGTLFINPSNVVLSIDDTLTFTASGGQPLLIFSVAESGSDTVPGTINSSTGVYTAPDNACTEVVRVTDSSAVPNFVEATVIVNSGAPLVISPPSVALAINETYTFTAFGGTPPYTFYIDSGSGTIVPDTGLYTAPDYKDNRVYVTVEDDFGSTATARVKVK